DYFLRDSGERLQRMAGEIFQDELKSAESSQAFHSGRREGNHGCAGNRGEGLGESVDHGIGRVRLAFALRVVFQRSENQTAVWGASAKTETCHGKGALNFGDFAHHRFRLAEDVRGVLERTALGRLNGDDEISGILVGNESLGDMLIDPVSQSQP